MRRSQTPTVAPEQESFSADFFLTVGFPLQNAAVANRITLMPIPGTGRLTVQRSSLVSCLCSLHEVDYALFSLPESALNVDSTHPADQTSRVHRADGSRSTLDLCVPRGLPLRLEWAI